MNMSRFGSPLWVLFGLALLSPTASTGGQEPARIRISEAKPDADGILVHAVESGGQDGPTRIRVLLPARRGKDRHPVLYVLPVEAGDGSHYGDGLLEVKKLGLHDK